MNLYHALIASAKSWDQSRDAMVERCQMIGGGDAPSEYPELNTFVSKAIYSVLSETSDSEISVVKIGEGAYATEWDSGNGTVICYANDKGELAATIRKGKLHQNIPTLGSVTEDFDTSSILACLYAVYAEKHTSVSFGSSMPQFSDMAPVMFKEGTYFIKWLQDNVVIYNGAIDALSRRRIDSGALSGEVVSGQPIILTGQTSRAKSAGMTFHEVSGKYEQYRLSQRLSEEQKKRIPEFPDDFIVPQEVDEIASWFIDSRNTKLEANNFMWRGITGCGKSTGTALLAAVLGKPLYIMTCHTTMETQDFLSSLIPASGNTAIGELPSFEDIEFDPEEAYYRITGKRKKNISSQEVLAAYAEAYASKVSGNMFKRVNSEFIQGLEAGGIVEIQEPSRIRDTGVLVGLNEYARSGARIPLIDGSYAYRSPDAITVWTDNIGYASCRTIDASVLRRMSAVFDVTEVDRKKTIERVLYNVGDNIDPDAVGKLFDVWKAIRDYCVREEIEGDMSPSDLENWTARIQKKGISHALELCKVCIISKASTDAEIQNTIESAIAAPMISAAFGSGS